jgi:gamma-glutamyl:cysteine ligase YbdK (ATP-grasp superfamily)
LNGAAFDARTVRNFVNIVASKEEILFKALGVHPERERFCRRLSENFVERLNRAKPKTLEKLADLWYEGWYGDRGSHYHSSRYSSANLHALFTRHHTIELRLFNSTLNPLEIQAYVLLALAINRQALTQKSASARKAQQENEVFAFRTYLNRIGFIGDEYADARRILTQRLEGNRAWRFRAA